MLSCNGSPKILTPDIFIKKKIDLVLKQCLTQAPF